MVFKFLSIDWKAIGTIVGWIIGYFLFLTLGGFLFLVLERSNDETLKNKKRKEFLEVLASYNISTNDTIIRNIVTAAIHAHDFNSLNLTNYNTEVSSEWNLGSAVFFAGTIVTTIGKFLVSLLLTLRYIEALSYVILFLVYLK